MSSHTAAPGIIVFVHGLRMTPRSWEDWMKYYGSKGYTVLAPPNSGFEIEVEAMRENPEVIANLTVAETVDHLAGVIELLDTPPSLITSLFPVPKNPANRHKPPGSPPRSSTTRSPTPSPGGIRQGVRPQSHRRITKAGGAYGLIAKFKPGHQETSADYAKDDRAPLLFIGGEADHIMPPSVNKSNTKRYHKPAALTKYHEFDGHSHWTCGEPGWVAVVQLHPRLGAATRRHHASGVENRSTTVGITFLAMCTHRASGSSTAGIGAADTSCSCGRPGAAQLVGTASLSHP
ncbi:alpha/beta hydrolase [Rhodococcus sp. NPDC059968]|uniref:alpha/beta hydrolase n=1 Tax=Rhodococcus sp. NPDC059968 TaxID=3347017 RepID=UPI00366B6CD8